MNNGKRMIYLALAMALVILFSGCSMVRVNEEKDRKIVVAQVNGQDILKGEILDQYRAFYGETEEYDKDIMTSILDSVIEEKLVEQKATAAGHVSNDDTRKRARQEYEDAIKSYGESLKEQAGEDADPNTDYEQQAREKIKENIAASGRTEEEYLELMSKFVAINDFLDTQTADLTVSDEEIEKYYEDELKFQKENPSLAAYYSSVTIVKENASRRVKHILTKLSDEDIEAINKLRQDDKDEEADNLREEKLKSIKDKAQEILEKAKSGEDFESLIEKHGEDPGMKEEEYKDGYTMLRDENMMEEFLNASFQMQEGEISDLVATDAGYHIIKVYEAKEDVIAPLEDVKEEIQTVLLNQKKGKKTDELIKEWLEKANVKKFEKRL